jgi:hypothetical protein
MRLEPCYWILYRQDPITYKGREVVQAADFLIRMQKAAAEEGTAVRDRRKVRTLFLMKPRLYFSDEGKSRQKLSLREWRAMDAVAFGRDRSISRRYGLVPVHQFTTGAAYGCFEARKKMSLPRCRIN